MDRRFLLTPEERCPITELDAITVVRLPIGEHVPLKTVKKRAKVAAGACVALHPSPNVGDLHAPFDGVVKNVTTTFIEIEYEPLPEAAPVEGEEAKAEDDLASRVAPVDFTGMDSIELGKVLKALGVDLRPFTRPCSLFIINGLNPEPGIMYSEELLSGYMPVLEAGFAMLRRLNSVERFMLVVSNISDASLEGAETRHITPVYPNSLARPLIRTVTGTEDTRQVSLARLLSLFQLGLVAQSGLPLTRSVVTAFGKNFLAPLGTPVETFMEFTGAVPATGDGVILGGAMRGVAIAGFRRGIRKTDDAMALVKDNSRPDLEDNPCINCGACVSVCPMRLRPNMLSRYSEFGQYEDCRKELIEVCIECGMCGYICPACRPMQQQFRMAKHSLGLSTFQHALRQ